MNQRHLLRGCMTDTYAKHLLNKNVVIESIENDVKIDEEIAIVKCAIGDEKLTVLWTYDAGFSVPVFINNSTVLQHVENQLKTKTVFHGVSSDLGRVGLAITQPPNSATF